MEQEQKKNSLIAILICIIVILVILCILFATGTIKLKGKKAVGDTTVEATLDNSQNIPEITNLNFSKPWVGNLHGGEIDTLIVTVTANIECTNNTYAGIRVSGTCLDKNDHKYLFEGPIENMAIYCDNNENHQNAYSLELTKVLDNNGEEVNTANIDYKSIEIKQCKFDKAKVMLTDGNSLNTEMEINYEQEFE